MPCVNSNRERPSHAQVFRDRLRILCCTLPGRRTIREPKVPIGIIDASWGGTSAETWTPALGLQALGYSAELDQAANLPQKADQKLPTRLYNGMIHPLRQFTIKGVVWYQGEGNAGRADKYHKLFSTMITQWREVFGYEFPFYFVQISPFNYRVYSGPMYRESVFGDGKARLRFDHAGTGLATRDGQAPSDFETSRVMRPRHVPCRVFSGRASGRYCGDAVASDGVRRRELRS